jgi:hypothetical protein
MGGKYIFLQPNSWSFVMSNLRKFAVSVAAVATMGSMSVAEAVDVTSNFDVTVALTSVCQISTAPGTVAFTYTAFQAGNATANTSFGVRCTNNLGYTMALDTPASQSVGGLAYTLALSAASGTGSGVAQPYTVNGTMVGGQAGDSTASATQTRTLTITY